MSNRILEKRETRGEKEGRTKVENHDKEIKTLENYDVASEGDVPYPKNLENLKKKTYYKLSKHSGMKNLFIPPLRI